VRIHLAAEHTLQLEAAYGGLEPLGIPPDVLGGGFIALSLGQLQELRRVGDILGGAIDIGDVGREARALLPELLRALRLCPDGRVFELPPYFFEALFLAVVLKETPVAKRCARPGL
jgi:hypothetical protein